MIRRFDPNTPADVQIRAVRDVYLMATPDKRDTAWAVLTSAADATGELLAACKLMDPTGICTTNRNIPDSMVVSFDVSMGELREFRAAIAMAAGPGGGGGGGGQHLEGAALARTFA